MASFADRSARPSRLRMRILPEPRRYGMRPSGLDDLPPPPQDWGEFAAQMLQMQMDFYERRKYRRQYARREAMKEALLMELCRRAGIDIPDFGGENERNGTDPAEG